MDMDWCMSLIPRWLKSKIHKYIPSENKTTLVYRVLNGIDTKIFFPKDAEMYNCSGKCRAYNKLRRA